MENKKINFLMIVVLLFGSLLIIDSSSFVSSETIIINPNGTGNPFNYSANNSQELNKSADYLANVTDETLRKLIEALTNSVDLNDEVKEYLKNIIKAYNNNQIDFNTALEKINYAYETMKIDRDTAVDNYNKLQKEDKIKFETLETEIEGIRMDNVKLKSWVYFYIFFGIAVGVLVLQISIYLKKNQKFYFVLRKIRDKIPIKL